MLVVTRKRSQMIHIGDDIVIKVLKTGKSTVKIGIDAPRHVRVLRSELLEKDMLAGKDESLEFPCENKGETAVACSDQVQQPHVA